MSMDELMRERLRGRRDGINSCILTITQIGNRCNCTIDTSKLLEHLNERDRKIINELIDLDETIRLKKELGEDNPTKFTFKAFKRGEIAVNCRTLDHARYFLFYLHGKGLKWRSGQSLAKSHFWIENRESTLYYYDHGVKYDSKDFYYHDEKPFDIIDIVPSDLD